MKCECVLTSEGLIQIILHGPCKPAVVLSVFYNAA